MKIAVEGCMHGDLDKVYATLLHIERLQNIKIDLLLCCGDFQAVRNQSDLNCMAVPEKYLSMKSFWKYYSGQEVAPIPTIFIGGNHEASNYLWELYYGGWAAPNIYFLGCAGVIKFGNLRIGGLSGIYDHRTYCLGHYERPPYPGYSRRTVYHVREYDVHKLLQVEEKIDIFLSHDWPRGITNCGNVQQLLRKKPYFKAEISKGILGSRAAAQLLDKLKPSYWFSAHLHCKFPAVVQHGVGGPITKFLALDKCLPHRNFLQVLEVDSAPGPYEIHYDEEWLAITKKYNPFFPLTRKFMEINDGSLDDCREWVSEKLKDGRKKPFDFVPTAPFHDTSNPLSRDDPVGIYRNRQTELLLEFLELPYLLDRSPNQVNAGPAEHNSEYIDIDNIEDDDDEDENGKTEVNAGPAEHNSEYIDIDNIEDADDEDNNEEAADEDEKGETEGLQSGLDK